MNDEQAAEIAQLEREVEETGRANREAKRRLAEALIAAAPHKVGDVIQARVVVGNRRQVVDALVRAVVVKYGTLVAYRVSPRDKGGEWSKVEREVWGHEIETAVLSDVYLLDGEESRG